MKVLFVSNSNPGLHNTNHYRVRALKALGHEVVVVDVRGYFFPARLRQAFPVLEALDMRWINDRIVHTALRSRVDVCLVVGGVEVSAEALRRIRSGGVGCVLWTSDAPHPQFFRNILKTAFCYSRIFCSGTEAVELLGAGGFHEARWLPFAADPQLHYPVMLSPVEHMRYRRAVSFVGAYYPNRARVLMALKDIHPGIWGLHWARPLAGTGLEDRVEDRHIDYTEWVKIYSSADIVLVVHYQDGKVPCYQASPKLFEAMACGAFVLCDDQKDARALFNDGEHLVFFKDEEDLKYKVWYYLEHPAERARIAAQGRREVLANHTWELRMRVLLEQGGWHG